MANIKVTSQNPIYDGMPVTFKAPCDCTAIDGLTVVYPEATENDVVETSQTFSFRDTHGNDLTGVGNLFAEGVLIKVLLDTVGSYAYIQNADTNGFLSPPMLLGIEYATAERWMGKTVYTKLVDFGTLKTGANSLLHGTNVAQVVKAYGQLSNGMAFPIPGTSSGMAIAGLRVGKEKIEIEIESLYANCTATVQMWYTKE